MAGDGQGGPRDGGEARVPEQGAVGRGRARDGQAPNDSAGTPNDPAGTGRPGGHESPAGGQVPPQRGSAGPAEEPPVSDAELVARVRGGDDSAYEELYRRHAEAVRRYARGCCRDAHTAEDLTGEVFARTLQAVRGGRGPESAVRAYLLTTVRRVAAAWSKTTRREQLVEDFAAFATSAAETAAGEQTTTAGADVRAMQEADRTLAVRAFRTLPERWQTVLWHTAVEKESPSEVAPLLGLTANATAVLAHRAREGLRQAYLQAHVSESLTAGGECARYADRLGAHARGGLRLRADRELRRHLEDCSRCRAAAADLADLNSSLRGLLPVATIGWFAAAYTAKVVAAGAAAAGAAGAAAGAAGAGATAGAAGAAGSSGAAGAAGAGAAAGEGLGLPAKIGIAAGVVLTAAGVALAATLLSDHPKAPVAARPPARHPVARPAAPPKPPAPTPAAPAIVPAVHRVVPPRPVPAPPPPRPRCLVTAVVVVRPDAVLVVASAGAAPGHGGLVTVGAAAGLGTARLTTVETVPGGDCSPAPPADAAHSGADPSRPAASGAGSSGSGSWVTVAAVAAPGGTGPAVTLRSATPSSGTASSGTASSDTASSDTASSGRDSSGTAVATDSSGTPSASGSAHRVAGVGLVSPAVGRTPRQAVPVVRLALPPVPALPPSPLTGR